MYNFFFVFLTYIYTLLGFPSNSQSLPTCKVLNEFDYELHSTGEGGKPVVALSRFQVL